MKLVVSEQLKHRLIGIAVIISLGAIFAPAMIKKSSQTTENNYSVRVKLPPKPQAPNVAVSDEKEVFKTIKIAKITLPEVSAEDQLPQLAKASRLQPNELAHETAVLAKVPNANNLQSVQVALDKASKTSVKQVSYAVKEQQKSMTLATIKRPTSQIKKKAVTASTRNPQTKTPAVRTSRQGVYAVQLASFSRLDNAQALVNKLHKKGYKANYAKVTGKHGVSYKVFAGHSVQKAEVLRVKTQLASVMQLNGFIVTTGVS